MAPVLEELAAAPVIRWRLRTSYAPTRLNGTRNCVRATTLIASSWIVPIASTHGTEVTAARSGPSDAAFARPCAVIASQRRFGASTRVRARRRAGILRRRESGPPG